MKSVNVSVKLPEELHKRVKIKLVLEGGSLQEYIARLVEEDMKLDTTVRTGVF
ncbi:MAG: hypothetical protein ACRCX8_10870 [Sarcina sp.]